MHGKNKQHIVITFRIINAFPCRQMQKNVLSVQGQEIIFPRTRRHKDMWRTNAGKKGTFHDKVLLFLPPFLHPLRRGT